MEKSTMPIEKLWSYACNGKIKQLREYYDNGGEVNRKYHKFGTNHSLVIGAFRNHCIHTVTYLLSKGETPSSEELDEMIDFWEDAAKKRKSNNALENLMALRKQNHFFSKE